LLQSLQHLFQKVLPSKSTKMGRQSSNVGVTLIGLIVILHQAFCTEEPVSLGFENVCLEFISSESGYIEQLSVLVDKFVTPARSILSPDDHKTIFQNIEEILQFHKTVWNQKYILQAFSTYTPENINKTVKVLEGARAWYKIYVKGYSKALQRLQEVHEADPWLYEPYWYDSKRHAQSSRLFSSALEHQRVKRIGANSLQSLLILPVQRLPRYELFIQSLLKEVKKIREKKDEDIHGLGYESDEAEKHEEIDQVLTNSYERMKRMVGDVNQSVTAQDRRQGVIEWSERIEGLPSEAPFPLVNPSREFLGSFRVWYGHNLLLFSDIMIEVCAFPQDSTMCYHNVLRGDEQQQERTDGKCTYKGFKFVRNIADPTHYRYIGQLQNAIVDAQQSLKPVEEMYPELH